MNPFSSVQMALIGVILAGAAYVYVHHKGVEDGAVKCDADKVGGLAAQIQAQNTFVAAQQEVKTQQLKEVRDVRKEVDDDYRAGRVPARVCKFYITAPKGCGSGGKVSPLQGRGQANSQ